MAEFTATAGAAPVPVSESPFDEAALRERVEGDLKRLSPLLVVLAILAVGLYLLVHFLRKPVPTADPEELPILGHQVAVKMESPETPPCQAPEAAPPTADGKPTDQAATPGPVK